MVTWDVTHGMWRAVHASHCLTLKMVRQALLQFWLMEGKLCLLSVEELG